MRFARTRLSELFENVGAALLNFAERAENNTIQGRFFEAMSLLQQRRSDIEARFDRRLSEGFDAFARRAPDATQDGQRRTADTASELTLVEPDELEEDVAAENLVVRANGSCFTELFSLSQRLSVVNGGRKLRDEQVPAGPYHLVDAFRRSIDDLDVEVKIKVILYALFDKYVMQQAKGMYEELNETLKSAGILPLLKPFHPPQAPDGFNAAARRRSHGQRPPAESDGERVHEETDAEGRGSGDGESLGSELFESILDLMSTRRGTGGGGRVRIDAGPAVPASPAAAAESSRRLVSALDSVQSRTTTRGITDLLGTPGSLPAMAVDNDFLEKVRVTFGQEREEALSQVEREALSPVDADLIDLIGMLFEYMLNDPVLPNLAKALLSHLHTPYLKVALIDRRLLVDPRHPARRLLDQLVEAGALWVDESNPQRGIFPAMQRTVDRVLAEFTDDVYLFESLLDDFQAEMDEQQRRTETTEQRTQEAARGREKLQLAKRRATNQIQTLLRRHPLPETVTAFLSRTWRDYLVFILLRDRQGEPGGHWRHAVETSELLVSLFAPGAQAAGRRLHPGDIASLKTAISEGVARMGSYSQSALEPLFELLDRPQAKAEPIVPAAAPETPGAPPGATEDRQAREPEPATPEEHSERQQAMIARLREMKLGTWFELAPSPGRPPRRIKLSWLSPLTSTCMFVDRSGMQAEIKTLQEVAEELLAGRAEVIAPPRHPFIERALLSVRKVLRGEGHRA
jgi:hypothetical protein